MKLVLLLLGESCRSRIGWGSLLFDRYGGSDAGSLFLFDIKIPILSYDTFVRLFQQFLELGCHRVADLTGARFPTDISSFHAGLDHIPDCRLNGLRLGEASKRVLHHHSDGQDSSDGVDDSFPGNIRRRP